MKTFLQISLFSGIICTFCSACTTLTGGGLQPLQDGYGYVVHSKGILHVTKWAELRYRPTRGADRLIWPVLWASDDVVISNGVAVIIGRKLVEKKTQDSSNKSEFLNALIAVKDGEIPCDISMDVLRMWCDQERHSFANISSVSRVSRVEPTQDGVRVTFTFWQKENLSPAKIILPWQKISTMIQTVTKQGIPQTEKYAGTRYFQRDNRQDE